MAGSKRQEIVGRRKTARDKRFEIKVVRRK
jgi:hypothetical protein